MSKDKMSKDKDHPLKEAFKTCWKMIGSVKLALVLLWAIIAVSFAGALLETEMQPLVYSSPWFFGLLGLFALNLTACSIEMILFKRKKTGSVITHAAVLVILAGALVSLLAGFRGSMELREGESSDSFKDGWRQRKLPFSVRLADFSLNWYPLDESALSLRCRVESAGYLGEFKASAGKKYPLGDTGYSFSVIKYMPHFVFNEDREAVNLSGQPLNPALLIHIEGKDLSEDRWVFALHPDIHMAGNPDIRFRFDYEPAIKEFRSRVEVSDTQRGITFNKDIKVNEPLEYRGYNIYQSSYDSESLSWTGLDVVYDPGVKIVFFGFILLNIGIIIIFYPKLKASLGASRKE